MKDLACPYCRDQDCPQVSIVRNPSVKASAAAFPLRKTGILCETNELRAALERKMDMSCPICSAVQHTHKELKKHFHDKHSTKTFCRVCFAHDYVFSDELEVYSQKALQQHIKSDHATCPFCDWNFYSNKELNKHCKTQHESCFICERDDPEHPQYFPHYGGLKDHFVQKHFMCMVPSCLEDKFIVFGSRIELQNHMLEQHKSLIDVKEMQRINIDDLPKQRQRPEVDENELVQRRYTERLRINAKGDNGLIDQVVQANHTYETKRVPADVFVKTYERVLGASHKDEITLLLEEFTKFGALSPDKRQALETALVHRRPEPQAPTPSSSKGPAPAPQRNYSSQAWAGRKKPVGGPLDVASLPRLGDGGGGAQRPAYFNTAPRIAVQRKPQPQPKPNLPSLPKQSWGQGPQTRLPALGERGSTQRPQWMSSGSASASVSTSASASASPMTRSGPSSASSSSTNLASSSSSPNFGALPSLPQSQKKQPKGSKKIVRII